MTYRHITVLICAFILISGCAKPPQIIHEQIPVSDTNLLKSLKAQLAEAAYDRDDAQMIAAEALMQLEDYQMYSVRPVHFDFDSVILTRIAQDNILYNMGVFDTFFDWKITLSGYCDTRGSKDYNYRLGWQRVKAVYFFLEAYGFDMDRVSMVSRGEDNLKSFGDSDDCHRLNRRVEFEVVIP
jgi:peptidoglycan-associated lipoprotein